MRTPRILKLAICGFLVITAPGIPQAVEAATVTWNAWTFDYEISGNYDGLSLKNVRYQGRTLIHKMSMPVLRVFYDNNACGPYADRLGGTLSPIPWANNATLAQREFTLDGRQWYEIGIRDQIGNYDLYQAYYLSGDGILDAHIYSKGLQCVIDHIHYPNWRIDFDVDGTANDVIEHSTGTVFQTDSTEFNNNATTAANHGWRVRDTVSNLSVDVLPGFSGLSIPDDSTTVPVTDYAQNTVFGRLYKAAEDTGWTYGPNTQVLYNEGENILNADIVLWYEAYMPHTASDGSALWHSTGIRLVSSLSDTLPPSAPANLSANATSSSQVNLSWTAATDNVGVTGYPLYPLERCQGATCTNFAQIASAVVGTAYTDTGLTASTSYSYRVRARDAAGNLGPYSNVASATTMAPAPTCTVTQSFASLADDKIVYKVTNTGNMGVTLDTLSLNFPSARQQIKLVQIGKNTVYDSTKSSLVVAPGVTIGANNWTNTDVTKRQWKVGATQDLNITFTKKAKASASAFSGTATFKEGCEVALSP